MSRRQKIGLILLAPGLIFGIYAAGWLIYAVIREAQWIAVGFIVLIACTIIGFGMMGD